MKKNFHIFTVAALLFGLCACTSNQPIAEQTIGTEQNPENSRDWAGVYTGLIPAASGPGINVTVTLNSDLTYEVQYQYVDRPDGDFTFNGTFEWDNDNGVIKLDTTDIPPYYKVDENKLTQLDMEGKPITGMLANDYILTKQH
jgi:uncharacterized lipoprotein NlpE involved in copper resistance